MKASLPIDDVQAVQVFEGRDDLGSVETSASLREAFVALQMEKELTAVDIVEDKVELLGGLERVAEADKEGVLDIMHKHVPLCYGAVLSIQAVPRFCIYLP